MVRISKQAERRNKSPRKRHPNLAEKTGPKKDNLSKGYKEHSNTIDGELAGQFYIPKIK